MKKIYYVDIVFLIVLALMVSTVLPTYVSYNQEQQLLNQTVVEEITTVQVSRTEKMEEKSALEKFAFLLEEGIEYIEYVPVVEGKTMQEKDAMLYLENELQTLFDIGVLPSGEFGIWNGQLYTAANINNPAQSLVVWKFLVAGAFGECYIITLDDTTGQIISLNAIWLSDNMELFYGSAYESVARFWGDYIGAGDTWVKQAERSELSPDRVLERMGSSRKEIMEYYGFTEEESLKEMLVLKNETAVVYDVESKNVSRTLTDQKECIALSVIYYLPEGTPVECILEWDANGYCFKK